VGSRTTTCTRGRWEGAEPALEVVRKEGNGVGSGEADSKGGVAPDQPQLAGDFAVGPHEDAYVVAGQQQLPGPHPCDAGVPRLAPRE
jgi:hypothetical protein